MVDWGLAKTIGRDDASSAINPEELTLRPSSGSDGAVTLPGAPLGTPAYISPEQAAGELDRLGPASDVYGLGATLYSLLTGKPPFVQENLLDVIGKVRAGAFPRPRAVASNVPRGLEAICLKAMATRPEDRYLTSQALIEDLEHCLADEPLVAYREGWTARLARWSRRHRAATLAAAAVLLIVAIAASVSTAIITRALDGENKAARRIDPCPQ